MKTGQTSDNKSVGTFLAAAVILLSLPATLYGVLSLIPETTLRALDRWSPNIPIISDLIALAWFVVLFGGRFFCLAVFILNIFLAFRRGTAGWLKLLASSLVLLADLGVLLVESQARGVRH